MITVEGLVKEFGNFRAVDEVSFEVKEGEIFGILGPNGAGKTTLVMILATLLKPTKGKASVAGYDIVREASNVRKKIGIVFQETTLDLELTARENLDFHARLYGMEKKEREKRIAEVLELVGLSDNADTVVKKFSGGMKRRLEIARGLIHSPEVLFLDEPTLGLDAITRRKIWDYIAEARKDATIVLNTNYIDEAERLCDRVAIMNRGKIIALEEPKKLINLAESVIILEGIGFEKLKDLLENYRYVLSGNALRIYTKEGNRILPEIISSAIKKGVEITSARIEKPTLEDVFIQITKKRAE
ncbi:MAG: ATP-binding cassette domain-containing protein [Archaeoglobus sp.]|nr:ATP-binding cassette domain-containing protein [Archaeoglobus sp.]